MTNNLLKIFLSHWHTAVFTILSFLPLYGSAQLQVTDTMTNQEIAQELAGNGVTISNVTVDCPTPPGGGAAHGYFDGSNANLNLSEGLLMTNGAIANAVGPNDETGVSSNNNTPGDSDLDSIVAPRSTNDACVFEFDIEPLGDTLRFNYSLGSDEFPEYVCCEFNDVFGFFITGPNPTGGTYNKKNIALIPNTSTPVSINSVNNGSAGNGGGGLGCDPDSCTSLNYSQYYVDNGDGNSVPQINDSTVLQYDGFTNGLYVEELVEPCKTYHLKLAIADVTDNVWDSGVFIEAESIVSTGVDISGGTTAGDNFQNAVEGCIDGLFTITLNEPLPDTNIVNLGIGGDATNGVDYATIPDSAVFAPGDTVEEIVIDAFDDGTPEPAESIELYLINQCNNQPYDTGRVFIQDEPNVSTGIQQDSITICRGESVQFQASGGVSFSWTPSRWLSDTAANDPIARPDSSTTYVVSTQLGTCTDYDSIHINVIPSGFKPNLQPDTNICLNQSVELDPQVQPPGNYDYHWSPPRGLSDTSVANPIATPSDSTTYYLAVRSSICTQRDTINVNVEGVAPNVDAIADADTVCSGGDVTLSVNTNPGTCGTNSSVCSGVINNTTLGTANTSTDNGTPYKGLYEDNRVQYLVRASELNGMGLNGGVIQEIAFDIASKNSSVPYNDFTIKMGCTSLSDFSSTNDFISGLDVVYTPQSVTTSAGWQTYTLDNAYDWNGNANLIIEVCFNNSNGNWTSDDEINYTSTSFPSVMANFTDGVTGCNITSSSSPNFTKGSNRPNIRLGACHKELPNATYTWTPASSIDSATAQTTNANPFQTTTYQVEVDNGTGCKGISQVTVATDTSLSVTATPDTSVCSGKSVQLNATAQGTPKPQPLTCGTNGANCANPSSHQIGTGSNATTSPTPYVGNSNGGTKARMQFIYRASDLNAQGLSDAIISSISFDVSTDQSPDSFRNMTIRMGCVSKNEFGNQDSFITGLLTVYTTSSYLTSTGWNTHQLNNTYDWDGSSNLVVEVCYTTSQNNTSGGGGSDLINTTSTGYNSVIFREDQFASGAGCAMNYNNLTTTINDQRPNIKLGTCEPPPGQFTYTWSPSSNLDTTKGQTPVATQFNTTDYVVSVTDGNCTARDTATVTIDQSFNLTVDGESIGCTGNQFGTAWAVASGGVTPYAYQWSNGQTTDTISNLNPGTYIVTVSDNINCKQIDTFQVTQAAPLVIDSFDVQHNACYGDSTGQASVFFSGGTAPYDINWSNGADSQTISGLTADTFAVSITDVGSCSDSDTIVIDQPSQLNGSIDTLQHPACPNSNDGLAGVTVNGGTQPYTYQWDDANAQTSRVATGLNGGTYNVTVTDDSGCTVVDTATLEQPDTFQINTSVQQTISCYGAKDGIVAASVNGDTSKHSFTWANQSGPVATGLSAGTHIVTATTDSSGCQQTDSISLTQPDSISLSINKSDLLCYGDTNGAASITANGDNGPPFTYNWNTGDTTSALSGLPAGSYGVSVTDTNNCTNTATVTIRQPQALQLTTSTTPISCNSSADGSATVEVTGGVTPYSYIWSDSDSQKTATADGLTDGNYTVTITDDNGCTATASATVPKPNPIQYRQLDVVDASCPGAEDGAVFVKAEGGTAPYEYRLEGNGSSAEGAFNGLKGNKAYRLTIEDANGCVADTLVSIEQPEEVVIKFQPDKLAVELGKGKELSPILLPPDTGTYDYLWEPSTGLSCVDCATPIATPYQQTNYELTLFDENDCRYSETIEVGVQNPEILYIPSAFTPDGNDRNDEFRIYGKNINRIHLQIFNRWGEMVFETKDPSEGWDGTYKGNEAPTGVYLFNARIEYVDGKTDDKQGSVTLIR